MELTGRVQNIFFQSEHNYYMIFQLQPEDVLEEPLTVSGHFPNISRMRRLKLYGNYKYSKKRGKTFLATSFELLEPTTKSELFNFLLYDVSLQPSFANLLSHKIGLEYLKKYKDIEWVSKKIAHEIDQETLKRVAFSIRMFYQQKEKLEAIVKMGFSPEIASKIVYTHEHISLEKIKENPYFLIGELGLEWNVVDTIALKNGFSKDADMRLKEGIYYLLNHAAVERAHMFLPQDVLVSSAPKFLNVMFNVEHTILLLEKERRVIRDFKKHLYSIENYESEVRVSDNLFRLLKQSKQSLGKASYGTHSVPYNTDQKKAIGTALKENVSLISGSAGTGKTTVLKKITETILQQNKGVKIVLCAPTGRAAKRMEEVTNLKAKTIHNILGYTAHSKTPAYNTSYPLEEAVYIVDEMSMVDVKLGSDLISAIPDGSKLIMMGDIEQLPSIGPGTLFKDLLMCGFFPHVILTETFRQKNASPLHGFVTDIKEGIVTDMSALPPRCDIKFIEEMDPKKIQMSIRNMLQHFIALKKFNHFNDIQIITPIHKGPIGTEELNKIAQDVFNPKGKEFWMGDRSFRLGDKIMQTKNDGDKDLSNGDIGRIIDIQKGQRKIVVDFYGKEYDFRGEEIFQLQLAYATTVHKLQGGECKFVVFPFHRSIGSRMLLRNLLYTGATRAKEQLVMIGEQEAISQSVQNNSTGLRYCNLLTRLKSARLTSLVN